MENQESINSTNEKQKHYVVYKITNKLNGKIYIGFHSTYNINDSYMGSGNLIRLAIKKYGKENFVKEILFDFDNKEEAEQKEYELVNKEFVENDNNYNLSLGGRVCILYGKHNGFYGKSHSKETIEKIQESRNKTIKERGLC